MRRCVAVLAGTGVLSVALSVAGCTSSSDGDSTPSATTTVTTTAQPSSPSGTGITGAPVTGSASTSPSGSGKTTGAGGGSGASGPGLCTPTVATFALGQQDGAAGTTFLPVIVTNASSQPCVTTGYPGVALLDDTGRQIAQAARETGSGLASTTITLAPGEKATALISATPADADGKDCAASPAFLFTLPDNTDSTKLTAGLPICSVRVRPFVKGTTGLN